MAITRRGGMARLLMAVACIAVTLFQLGAVSGATTGQFNLTLRGSISLKNAAFLDLVSLGDNPVALAITTFTGNPFVGGGVYLVNDLSGNFSDASPVSIDSKLNWPNNVSAVPSDAVTGGFTGVGVGYGFLVPGKSIGGVELIATDGSGASFQMTKNKGNPLNGGWFYHTTQWMDMNGDGLQDIVTARATKPIIGSASGQFLWLEQPSGDNPLSSTPWNEHVMASGSNSPDIFFVPADLDGDGVTEFVYASFFTGAGLGLAWSDGAPGTPFGLGTIQTLSIDASIAPAFSASVTDLNNDGKPDVLVTNHVDDAPKSGVWAYEPPRPPAALNDTSAWVKHTLATGFKVTEPGFHQAAPGAAFAVYPRVHDTAGKPYIVVAGDGSQGAYILSPDSEQPDDWSYTLQEFLDCHATVGQLAVGDADGDGWTDVFVPCYDSGIVHHYSFQSAM